MTLKDRRDAILEGSARAAEAHKDLSLRSRLADGSGPVDVFRVIVEMRVECLFRPLNKLLGVFLRTPTNRGILVTTQRDLYVQRYTAAHELGHFLLNHEASFDDESQIGLAARDQSHSDLREVAADSFASEFLMPRWLIAAQVRRQKWSTQALKTPAVVYQLSLRLGVSYQAMCWALASHRAITLNEARGLAAIPPRKAKLDTVNQSLLTNSWANVWLLTPKDSGLTIVGSPDDVIQVELNERASSGLSWNLETATKQRFQILQDERRNHAGIGSFGVRRVIMKGSGQGELHMAESRHWDPESKPKDSFTIKYFLQGKESGLPSVCRTAN